jgi:hypothetical protein
MVPLRDPMPATPHLGCHTPRGGAGAGVGPSTPLSAAAMLTQSPAIMPKAHRGEYLAIPNGAM